MTQLKKVQKEFNADEVKERKTPINRAETVNDQNKSLKDIFAYRIKDNCVLLKAKIEKSFASHKLLPGVYSLEIEDIVGPNSGKTAVFTVTSSLK